MSRYIDAEPIEKFITDGLNNQEKPYGWVGVEILTEVHYAPTADVAPVVHAHWIPLYGRMFACGDTIGEIAQTGYKCSACGREEEDRWQICRCGARMDEEVDK